MRGRTPEQRAADRAAAVELVEAGDAGRLDTEVLRWLLDRLPAGLVLPTPVASLHE